MKMDKLNKVIAIDKDIEDSIWEVCESYEDFAQLFLETLVTLGGSGDDYATRVLADLILDASVAIANER